MPSPFPGMDPFLEGYLWPDVHHRLATEISRRLSPLLRPRYVARLEVYLIDDESPETEIGILYPDVEVLRRRGDPMARPGDDSHRDAGAEAIHPAGIRAPVVIPLLGKVEARVSTVEVRDAAENELVTSIEILSPANKREPGLSRTLKRRERLSRSGVHLLEVDLLRRGSRPLKAHPLLPEADYMVTLTRTGARDIEVWPIALRDPLPDLPVPLRAPDPAVVLRLGASLQTIYDEAGYDLSVDYAEAPPPPPLSEQDAEWLRGILARKTTDR